MMPCKYKSLDKHTCTCKYSSVCCRQTRGQHSSSVTNVLFVSQQLCGMSNFCVSSTRLSHRGELTSDVPHLHCVTTPPHPPHPTPGCSPPLETRLARREDITVCVVVVVSSCQATSLSVLSVAMVSTCQHTDL